jgi:hypothetical protein
MKLRRPLSLLLLAALASTAACTTGGAADRSLPPATARLTLRNVVPVPRSTLTAETQLVATIDYAITNFQPGTDYYLAPLFATNVAGQTFNASDRLDQSPHLRSAEGTVTVQYSPARELRSPQLAHPVRVSFYLMERTDAQHTHVIGKTEAVEYATAR